MTLYQHFVIANSAFSLWGACLENNPSKQVIPPEFEMRDGNMWRDFDSLMPAEWIKL